MGRYTPEQTYRIMSGIHSKDTDIEVVLRKALWHKGYRYRKNVTSLIGKPDIVFTKHKLAIFCDSEFWHGKDWDILRKRLESGKNPDYWIKKIERNRQRDITVNTTLESMGWTVLRFWGKEIISQTEKCVEEVEETILEIRLNSLDLVDYFENDDL